MQLRATKKDKTIILKKYTSYEALDKDIMQFDSLEDLRTKLNLDEEYSIYALDNDGNPISFDIDKIRKTLAFYDKNQGDEFVDWIVDSSAELDDNNGLLLVFFNDKFLNYRAKDLNYAEGKRIYDAIGKVRKALNLCGLPEVDEETNEIIQPEGKWRADNKNYVWFNKDEISKAISNYLKIDGEYNYGYMRNFIISLSNEPYKYVTPEPGVPAKEPSKEVQDKILYKYGTAVYNATFEERNVTIDDLMKETPKAEKQEEPVVRKPIYGIDGNKLDEEPFLEEFVEKEKAKKNIKTIRG